MKLGLILKCIAMASLFIICSAWLYCTDNVCFFASSLTAEKFGYWRDFCVLKFMVKDAETKSEMLVAVVALVILTRKYGVVKCSTDPRGRGGHKESACLKNGFLGLEYGHKESASLINGFLGLEYLLQLRGNRFATAWKDLVVFPVTVVSVYNSDQTHPLRRLASFARFPSDRLPTDYRLVYRLVSSGYFFDETAQTIICFACGRGYPSHAPDCGREHENVTSFPVPPPLPVGPDGDVADVGRMNVQVRTSCEHLPLLLNENTASVSIVRVAVPETGSEGGDARASTSAGDASGLIENQVCVLFIVFLLTLYVCLAVSVSFCLCLSLCFSLHPLSLCL